MNPLPRLRLRKRKSEEEVQKSRPKPCYTYGSISGVQIGQHWLNRSELSKSGCHTPVGGWVHAGPEGAYSILVSDSSSFADFGNYFIYKSGVRENLSSQALLRSANSLLPLRVVRSHRLKSPFSPKQGLRYDGLYVVWKWWVEKTKEGFLKLNFKMVRESGQRAGPWLDINTPGEDVAEAQVGGAATGRVVPDEPVIINSRHIRIQSRINKEVKPNIAKLQQSLKLAQGAIVGLGADRHSLLVLRRFEEGKEGGQITREEVLGSQQAVDASATKRERRDVEEVVQEEPQLAEPPPVPSFPRIAHYASKVEEVYNELSEDVWLDNDDNLWNVDEDLKDVKNRVLVVSQAEEEEDIDILGGVEESAGGVEYDFNQEDLPEEEEEEVENEGDYEEEVEEFNPLPVIEVKHSISPKYIIDDNRVYIVSGSGPSEDETMNEVMEESTSNQYSTSQEVERQEEDRGVWELRLGEVARMVGGEECLARLGTPDLVTPFSLVSILTQIIREGADLTASNKRDVGTSTMLPPLMVDKETEVNFTKVERMVRCAGQGEVAKTTMPSSTTASMIPLTIENNNVKKIQHKKSEVRPPIASTITTVSNKPTQPVPCVTKRQRSGSRVVVSPIEDNSQMVEEWSKPHVYKVQEEFTWDEICTDLCTTIPTSWRKKRRVSHSPPDFRGFTEQELLAATLKLQEHSLAIS